MINKLYIILFIIVYIFFTQTVFACHNNNYPNSFITFRDTVYMQNKNILEIMCLYNAAKEDISNSLSGVDKYLLLARCEYLIGITFRVENRNHEAAAYFEKGIAWAEESINICPTSEGYRLLGTNISFLCEVRTSYGLRNFKKIEENARKALKLDPNNLMAKYLIAAFYISAPWPISNVKKGLVSLEEILQQNYSILGREDQFNLFLMLQTAYLKLKKNQEANIWRESGEVIYPTNNFIRFLIE